MDRVGTDVERELARFGPAAGMAAVVRAWPDVVGDAIAANAWPARLARDGTLHVATSASAWAFELTQLAPELLARLRAALGDDAPRGVRFAPGIVPSLPSPESTTERAPAEPTPSERRQAGALVASLDDEELRTLAARAAAAWLARRRSDR